MVNFRMIAALGAAALGLSGLAFPAGPAHAEHLSPPCMVITSNTMLTGDVGPCSGHGIIIAADNITLDLAGYTVSGARHEMEQAGVFFDGVSGSTVKNGTVTGFDAGVAIEAGAGNTVTGLSVMDNVNDMIEPLDPRTIVIDQQTGPTPEQREQLTRITCIYGGGITTRDSNSNTITGNTVTGNGPFSGISLVGDSDGNNVSKNEVHENDLLNNGVVDEVGNPVFVSGSPGPGRGFHVPAGTPGAVRPQSMCGATEVGTPRMERGREVQGIGVRVEGPGADMNAVEQNAVTKSGLAGISFHSYVLVPNAPNVPVGESNRNNLVSKNSVSLTGVDTHTLDSFADGIASLAFGGPNGTVTRPSDSNTIEDNTSFDNFRHGISLGRLSFSNTVEKNKVTNNGGSGIWVAGPVTPDPDNSSFDARGAYDNLITKNAGRGNAEFDGTDMNPDCDNNRWSKNTFVTVSQPCVAS